MLCAVDVCIMVKTTVVCQNVELVGEPTPAENRESHHPVEVGKIAEQIQGISLAPLYSAKQLREINRRSIRRKLAFRSPSTRFKRNVSALSDHRLDREFDDYLKSGMER
jgi:hypothetical protein